MQPRFVAPGTPVPPRSLVCDGLLPGAERTLSHWHGAPEIPPPLRADSSTEILTLACTDPERWLSGLDWACNDHVDADGLLALALACQPAFAVERELLIGAAEAGDFTVYPGERAYRLMLRLHQYIRMHTQRGPDGNTTACAGIVDALPALIHESGLADPERDAQVELVEDVRARLLDGRDFEVRLAQNLVAVSWKRRLGQGADPFLAVHQAEDLPLHAMDALAGARDFQLLAMRTADGTVYQLDAPRHSWANTVVLPLIQWPDLTTLAADLQAGERGPCRWVARPQAAKVGFVCQLASIGPDGRPAASGWAIEPLLDACAQALAKRP